MATPKKIDATVTFNIRKEGGMSWVVLRLGGVREEQRIDRLLYLSESASQDCQAPTRREDRAINVPCTDSASYGAASSRVQPGMDT